SVRRPRRGLSSGGNGGNTIPRHQQSSADSSKAGTQLLNPGERTTTACVQRGEPPITGTTCSQCGEVRSNFPNLNGKWSSTLACGTRTQLSSKMRRAGKA